MNKKIKSALISVYDKGGLEPVLRELDKLGITIYSTGGTQKFIEKLGIRVIAVEETTGYPSILGGRVKTLHPKIFGGILTRRGNESDGKEMAQYQIPEIDLVIVDLYPFEETLKAGKSEAEIIEKIDIGGVALLRAAAKNFTDTLVVPSPNQYDLLIETLQSKNGGSDIEDRKLFAAKAFMLTSHYDTRIFEYFNSGFHLAVFAKSELQSKPLRYGENPHQNGIFYGDLNELFEILHGKELSYNNLVDVDAAINLIAEFEDPTVAVIKHTNSCGLASRNNISDAYKAALACDPISAFGGIICSNRKIDAAMANEINALFFEVLVAPGYDEGALNILKLKKNRILIRQKKNIRPDKFFKSILNGIIEQDADLKTETKADFKIATNKQPNEQEIEDLIFAVKAVKHLKSNGIALVKNKQLIGMGCGQTSRIEALQQAIKKANEFGFNLQEAVMASDAFFPFPDCVNLSHQVGITAIVQPGGSIRDQDSVNAANTNGQSMVLTGIRHFTH